MNNSAISSVIPGEILLKNCEAIPITINLRFQSPLIMNSDIYERIKDLALYIEKFRELEESEQGWLKQLLANGKSVLRCLELLEEIENQSLNYYELSDRLECSAETVKQRLNALIAGGIAIREERDGRFISPVKGGRPRKLARKSPSPK